MLTRRDFLQRLGVVAGSSAVAAAMTSWDLLAQQVGARPAWMGRPTNVRVIVLGAGLSGLAVGHELGKLGYDYRVLEARDRVGGVNWTIRQGTQHHELGPDGSRQVCAFDNNQYFNAGPWRIPHTDTGVLDYCKELDVPLQIFLNENDASFFYYENCAVEAFRGRRIRLREVKADMAGYTNELLAKAIDEHALDMTLTAEDRDRLVTFLVTEGYLDSADHVYKGTAARGPGDPLGLDALLRAGFGSRIRSVQSGTGASPMFQPVGGMDMLPRAFQRTMGDRITLGAKVEAVHQHAYGVRVRYLDTASGEPHELTADYVVTCLPLTALRSVDINLSPEILEIVKETPYSTSAKMGLQMRRRFWEEDDGIFGGHLYSDLPLGEFSYPSNDFFARGGVLMGFYGNGRIASLHERPVPDRVAHVLSHAEKVHPQIRTEYQSAYSIWWEKIEYSHGAYASGGADRVARLSKPDNRIFFGCAAAHRRAAWQQGAIEAAWQAVSLVHDRTMRG